MWVSKYSSLAVGPIQRKKAYEIYSYIYRRKWRHYQQFISVRSFGTSTASLYVNEMSSGSTCHFFYIWKIKYKWTIFVAS